MKHTEHNAKTPSDKTGIYATLRAFLGAKGGSGPSHRWHAGALVAFLLVAITATVSATQASAAECPNEALRSENRSLELPDCRSYERVSPAVKNGGEFNESFLRFLGDGPRLAFRSFATFGGAESADLIGSSYEFRRSSAGWSTRPLGSPAAQFEGTNFATPLYSLGEEGKSLYGLRKRGEPVDAESLYVGDAAGFTEIGPEAPPASWIGRPNQESLSNNLSEYFTFKAATPNLSHVAYSIASPESGGHSYLWPFDATGDNSFPSLYQYAGTGNSQPRLVGVSGGPGSSDLIGGCGTSFGSFSELDTHNAMSEDGDTIYFTPWGKDLVGECETTASQPAVTELYARIDGAGSTAHTVAISEPTPEDCSACQTTSRQEATFQGASADGSKVFFLTEQELVPGNPGKNLYEYNFDATPGARVTAVSHLGSGSAAGVLGVARVSEGGSRVYFVATSLLTPEANSTGATAQPGEPNLYAYDTNTHQTKFVATLSVEDSGKWGVVDFNRQAEATPDGRYLLFASVADLTPDDTSSVSQLFRYDFSTGQLIRVSVGRNGFNQNGNTDEDPVTLPLQVDRHVGFIAFPGGPPQKVMSDDGAYIFFESTKALTPKAFDHAELPNHQGLFAENVYEWHDGEVSLLSDGKDRTHIGLQAETLEQRSSTRLLGTDSSGENVLFLTASRLIPSDTDEGQDVYDARINGGFTQAPAATCSEEGCQGGLQSQPPATVPGSATFSGPGNQQAAKKKKKGKRHKKRHHGAKKAKHRKAAQHERATQQRLGAK